MTYKQDMFSIIDEMPQELLSELYNYASYLKYQEDKKTRNAAYLAKIQRGIDQCAKGEGIERDIIYER